MNGYHHNGSAVSQPVRQIGQNRVDRRQTSPGNQQLDRSRNAIR